MERAFSSGILQIIKEQAMVVSLPELQYWSCRDIRI